MIPSYIMQVDSISLTPNGKIDRRALPVPEIDIAGEYIAPENEVETKLVEIWSEVLGIEKEKISITANFFRLGGHSLKAIILIEKLHKELNVRVPLAAIFRFPTIREIAVIVSANILKDKPEIDEEYEEIMV
jgi:acyl carrier protein